MAGEAQIQLIRDLLEEMLSDDPDCFLVDIRIKPTNNIRVAVDADKGLPIEKCVSLNRRLYKKIVEGEIYPDGEFSLEISSPGLDEPLKMHRQYLKNIGRSVEVLQQDGQKTEGTLTGVTDEYILVNSTSGKNKKQVVTEHNIPFVNIKSTTIQIKF